MILWFHLSRSRQRSICVALRRGRPRNADNIQESHHKRTGRCGPVGDHLKYSQNCVTNPRFQHPLVAMHMMQDAAKHTHYWTNQIQEFLLTQGRLDWSIVLQNETAYALKTPYVVFLPVGIPEFLLRQVYRRRSQKSMKNEHFSPQDLDL